MAFFKFRRGDDESPGATQPDTVEGLRRRARHRLIGAAVLVLLGVVAFQLLFDTQPRPIAVDIPIEIPDRNKVKPLAQPSVAGTSSNVAAGPVTSAATKPEEKPAAPAVSPSPPATAVPAASSAAVAPAPRPEPRDKPKPEPRVETRPEPKSEPRPDVRSAAVEGRYVVQVGAFADVNKAREMRLKVEKAGFKTYTHVAETKDGKRIRVRVGPYSSRAEADKAADRIKGLDLPAAILTL